MFLLSLEAAGVSMECSVCALGVPELHGAAIQQLAASTLPQLSSSSSPRLVGADGGFKRAPWLELSKCWSGAVRREAHNDSDAEGETSANL